jgi:C1A family cysteine protease
VAGELAAISPVRRSPEAGNDYGVAEATLGDAPLPDAVDLRRPWQPVTDQGVSASCVGWTVADALHWHLVEAGRLEPDQRLSPRYVWMAAKEMFQREEFPSTFLEEDGTSLKAGLDVVRKFGAALEAELPFAGGLVRGSPEEFTRRARRRRIMAYYNLGDDTESDRTIHFSEWRRWLHDSGPVLVLIKVDRHIHTNTGLLDDFDEKSVTGSHAAAIYGYDAGHFLLRSSWGTDWGDQGYARMTHAYTGRAVIESYGVMV